MEKIVLNGAKVRVCYRKAEHIFEHLEGVHESLVSPAEGFAFVVLGIKNRKVFISLADVITIEILEPAKIQHTEEPEGAEVG